MHNIEKWESILQKFCGVYTRSFLKMFFNIAHERFKAQFFRYTMNEDEVV